MKNCILFSIVILIVHPFSQLSFAQLVKKEIINREFEKTKQVVVMISAYMDGSPEFGAGIIVGRKKDELLIATAYHFLHNGPVHADKIQVEFRTKPGQYLQANILKHSSEEIMDLALLSVKDLSKQGLNICSFPWDRLSDTLTLKPGDGVFPLGNPNGTPWAMPVVADKIADILENNISFQSSFISKGNSGGALLDDKAGITGLVIADQPPFGRAINIIGIIHKLKEWGYQINLRTRDYKGQTPLHLAAGEGDLAKIKNLLSDCNSVNQRDDHQATPLHFAAYSSIEATKFLVQYGADLNLLDADGDPPLEWADEKRNVENIRILVNAGGKWRQFTPLIVAGIKGDITTLKTLLKDKQGINKRDDHQATPLHYFAAYATKEAVNLLLAAGADMKAKDEDEELPIEWAAQSGRIDIMQLLHAKESGGKITSSYYLSSAAVKNGQIEVMKYLFATDDGLKKQRGNYLLSLAIRHNQMEMFKFLLKDGGDWEWGNASTQISPLITSVATGRIEAIKILMKEESGIINSPGILDDPDRTFTYPLDFLFEQKWQPKFMLEVLTALVSVPGGKLKIDSPWSLGTIFTNGFSEDFVVDAIKLLIPALADINDTYYENGSSNGASKTLLAMALDNGYSMAARILREHGAKK